MSEARPRYCRDCGERFESLGIGRLRCEHCFALLNPRCTEKTARGIVALLYNAAVSTDNIISSPPVPGYAGKRRRDGHSSWAR